MAVGASAAALRHLIQAAAIPAGMLPGDPPEQPIARESTRGAAPWETRRRGHPPWETHPGFPAEEPARRVLPPATPPGEAARVGPPWDTARGGPPWEAARGAPPWETVRGDPPWDTVRNDEPPAGSGSDPGAPPWPAEPPALP